MSNITVSRITHSTVIIDDLNTLGFAKTIELPKISYSFAEHNAVGMFGKINLPAGGMEALEMSIDWNSFNADIFAKLVRPFEVSRLTIRGVVDDYNAYGRKSAPGTLLVECGAIFNETSLGSLEQSSPSEWTSTCSVTTLKISQDGRVLINYDPHINRLIVDGVDVNAARNEILGVG